jgi:hypothetical protein
MDKILNACTRQSLAESALYTYFRGGTDITGPSIRLAEAIAQAWGNLDFGIRELEQKNGASTVEAYAWDMESNTRQTKIFQVKHWRSTKKGGYQLSDPRDIYEHIANNAARRLRACILGVIPGDVVEAAVNQCNLTLKTKADVTPERIANLLEKFSAFGVTKKQIEERIQRRIDAITPALMVSLGKIYNSLKDGMSAPADWFTPGESAKTDKKGTDGLKDKLKGQKKADKKTDSQAEKPESDQERWDNHFRQKWINLRKAGFADFVHKNAADFRQSSDALKAEAMEKWASFYEGVAPPKCLHVVGDVAKEAEKSISQQVADEVMAGAACNQTDPNLADLPEYQEYMQCEDLDTALASEAKVKVFGENREPKNKIELEQVLKAFNRLVDERNNEIVF